MKVLLKTSPVPGATRLGPDGKPLTGTTFLVATLFDPGEPVPPGYNAIELSRWRNDSFTLADGSMRVPFAPDITPPAGVTVPAAVIPGIVLRGLPGESKLDVSWHFRIGGMR